MAIKTFTTGEVLTAVTRILTLPTQGWCLSSNRPSVVALVALRLQVLLVALTIII
jgi:hypothetical protein